MQGMFGCYIKSQKEPRDAVQSPSAIIEKMISALGKGGKELNSERYDFTQFSLVICSLANTPFAFKPFHEVVNGGHIFLDGFLKNKNSVLNNLTKTDSFDPLSLCNYSGIFNLISYDESLEELVFINDRHGAKYLYYYEDEVYFIFAPNPKLIISSGVVKKKDLDFQAVISLLSHEYIMGNRSLVESIKLVPHATLLIYKHGQREMINYWNFDTLALKDHCENYDTLLKNCTSILKKAIESYAVADAKILIPLSGGLDSRTISCFLSNVSHCNAMHVDYGFEKKLAQRIADQLNINLQVFQLQDLNPSVAIDPFILCACNSIHQFWIYQFLQKMIEQNEGTIVTDGYLMNEVIGGVSTLRVSDYSDFESLVPGLDQAFDFILGPRIKKNFYGDHNSQVREALSKCPSDDPYKRYLYFTILNFGRRYTLLFSIIHQYICSVGLPILDYELMEFCLNLPFATKINSRFYRDMIAKSFPEVAEIHWSRSGLPLSSKKSTHYSQNIKAKIEELKYYATRITNARMETLPKHDKNRRFRKEKLYREYFMNIIFDDRTFEKGYVSKQGLEKIVQLIDTGRNYFEMLESIAVIEIVSRELGVE